MTGNTKLPSGGEAHVAPVPASHTQPAFRLGYQRSLNGIRGLAIILVVIVHTFEHLPGCLGFMAVDVFFVLSGFLITCLLIEEWEQSGKISLSAFYMRRALRLLPALLVLLVVFVIFNAFVHKGDEFRLDLAEARAVLFYYMNWTLAFEWTRSMLLRHAWSLSVEEQFYLLWPPLLLLMLRRKDRLSVLNFTLLGVSCSWSCRLLLLALNDWYTDSIRMMCGLDTRADALLIGCATAIVVSSGLPAKWGWTKRALRIAVMVSVPALIIIGLRFDTGRKWMYLIGWLMISLFAALVILGLMTDTAGWVQRALETRWLVYVGTISYSLYLWHFPILRGLKNYGLPLSKVATLGIGGSIVMALASYYFIERPFLRLKIRFQKVKVTG